MNLSIDTTYKCNRSCASCLRAKDYNPKTLSDYRSSNITPLDTRCIKDIIYKVSDYASKEKGDMLKTVTLTGGEPLLYPDQVTEIAEYCRDVVGSDVTLFTNGDALRKTPDLLEELYKSGITSIQIGVHEYEYLSDLFKMLENHTHVKQENSRLQLYFTLNNETEQYIEEIMKSILKFCVSKLEKCNAHIKFIDMIPLGKYEQLNEIVLTKDSKIISLLKDHYDQLIGAPSENIELMNIPETSATPSSCPNEETLSVNAFGDVGYCLGCFGPNWFGNVITDDIASIMEKKEEVYNLLKRHDQFLVPYKLARKLAIEKRELDYDTLYRPYCACILSDLFYNHGSIEDLESAFEEMSCSLEA